MVSNFLISFLLLCSNFVGADINLNPIQLTKMEQQDLLKELNDNYQFDIKENMVKKQIMSKHYHSDLSTGIVHDVLQSFKYAKKLLLIDDIQMRERACNVLWKVLSLQTKDQQSKYSGVWPYHLEEPLSRKESPVDYNWADFCSVELIGVLCNSEKVLSADLKDEILFSLKLAADRIIERNVGLSYTNIALMDIYVTYMVGNILKDEKIVDYGKDKLYRFKTYTENNHGFVEYNSPAYLPVCLDLLKLMKDHFRNDEDLKVVNFLYSFGWEILALHFHAPSGQWAGPNSRSYSDLSGRNLYSLLYDATSGKVALASNLVGRKPYEINHSMPEELLSYFLDPIYPKTENDVFDATDNPVEGTTYMNEKFVVASTNRSSLWNQRRPLIIHWGTPQNPSYFRVRFLRNMYDFAAANLFCAQDSTNVLAAINFAVNGGRSHISIDRIRNGKFSANDLRLRFEFGGENRDFAYQKLNTKGTYRRLVTVNGNRFIIDIPYMSFIENIKESEIVENQGIKYIDFIFYSGKEKEFDLLNMNEAVMAFLVSVNGNEDITNPVYNIDDTYFTVKWNDKEVMVLKKPAMEKEINVKYKIINK